MTIITRAECAGIIARMTPEEHKPFEKIADGVAVRGLRARAIEELALQLTALFMAAGVEMQLPPADWKSRRQTRPGTRPLRELVEEERYPFGPSPEVVSPEQFIKDPPEEP